MRRDYVFIKEAVEAYVLLAGRMLEGHAVGESYNFSNNRPLRVLEIVAEIAQLMKRNDLPPVILNEATNEIPDQFLDASKAAAELGWRPKYTLEAGLRETIAWYEAFLRGELATARVAARRREAL
jgi:CDP-glucose 4,6-dehydratase